MDIREETGSRALPNSTEAEISVLGAMLQDSTAVLRAAEQLIPDIIKEFGGSLLGGSTEAAE